MSALPIVVIGAGPQGLAAAVHLLERGLEPLVLEAGASPAASVAQWGHVRMFSAWPELIDPASARLLAAHGWEAPRSGYPTGGEWVDRYLRPLALALGRRVQLDRRVVGVARASRDLMADGERTAQPFAVHVRDTAGREDRVIARAVIDASGTWSNPNPLGADGLPALGERDAADLILRRIPDRTDAGRLGGRRLVVVGSGHSAFTAVVELEILARAVPDTDLTWAVRRPPSSAMFGGGAGDGLPERGALGQRARAAVERGSVDLVTGFRVRAITRAGDGGAVLEAEDGAELGPFDVVVVLTGARPDLSFLSEVRLDLDPAVQAPRLLAAEIDPRVHSCGTVRATGAAELAQPERDFYLVGSKSYGRAPTFLALTGYEQVRSVVAAIAGDRAAASRVELALPSTGVCGGSGLDDGAAVSGGCCGPVAVPLEIRSASRAALRHV